MLRNCFNIVSSKEFLASGRLCKMLAFSWTTVSWLEIDVLHLLHAELARAYLSGLDIGGDSTFNSRKSASLRPLDGVKNCGLIAWCHEIVF